jgi:ABC-type uncharacterized transport system permease subunit
MTARVSLRDWTYIAVMVVLLASYVVSLLSQGLEARAADSKHSALDNAKVSVCALPPSRS